MHKTRTKDQTSIGPSLSIDYETVLHRKGRTMHEKGLDNSSAAWSTAALESKFVSILSKLSGLLSLSAFGPEGWFDVFVTLVEKFDTEFNSDFSAKSPNFRGLVLFCIEADFCTQIRIFQHFSRTTRFAILCTSAISKFKKKFVKLFRIFAENFAKFSLFFNVFHWILRRFWSNFHGI